MVNKLIFKKYNDIDLDSLATIDSDIHGNILTSRKGEGSNYIIETHKKGQHKSGYCIKIAEEIRYVQKIEENILVVVYDTEISETKAYIYNKEGLQIRSFDIGKGIRPIRVDDKNRIWVGYIDEGIFDPDSTMEKNGLACFDEFGKLLFNNLNNDQELLLDIYECNTIALNNQGISTCFYGEDSYVLATLDKQFSLKFYLELELKPVDCLAIGKETALITSIDHKGYMNAVIIDLNSKQQKEVKFYNEDDKELTFEKLFSNGNQIFGLLGNSVYGSYVK